MRAHHFPDAIAGFSRVSAEVTTPVVEAVRDDSVGEFVVSTSTRRGLMIVDDDVVVVVIAIVHPIVLWSRGRVRY
jgi:hypothetical protein